MPIKVLIVDDSIFMRTLISDMLKTEPEIKVIGTCNNGYKALELIPKLKPDVITLDIIMPKLDGPSTLKEIMDKYPTPTIILSAYSKEDAEVALQCLKAGAISFVLKPSGELSLDIEKIKQNLIYEIRAASRSNIKKLRLLHKEPHLRIKRKGKLKNKIVVIGASTGGQQTIDAILTLLPDSLSASIIVVQHMPDDFFITSFIQQLRKDCHLTIKELKNNNAIQNGIVYIVPSGYKLKIREEDHGLLNFFVTLTEDKSKSLSPSVDEIMKSVSNIYKENTLGIILTGMGHDGVIGMQVIKENDGKTIVQDESALIFGMPKAVIDAGFADEVLSTREIARRIVEFAQE